MAGFHTNLTDGPELHDIEIVISGSWREVHSLDDEMREFFSRDIQGRVIGVTPDLPKLASDGLPGVTDRHIGAIL